MKYLLALLTLLSTTAHADPLRYRMPLIARLADARFDPPLSKNDLGEPCKVESYENPYSPLPEPMRKRHHRVTAASKKAVVELRDAYLIDLPRAVTFDLDMPADARLDFAYRVAKCGPAKTLVMVVTASDATGTITRRVPLAINRPPKGEDAWREVALDLPVTGPTTITVDFDTDAKRGDLMLQWAEPAISGRDVDGDPTKDTNVLWVVIDAVRSDALGPQRTFPLPTPSLDRPFLDGTAFAWAYSMGNQTRTSTTAMIASAHPAIGGFHSHDWAFARGKLSTFYDSRPPLATQVLEAAGWRVAHFGHNFFLWGDDPVGIDAGFPRIDDFRSIPADAVDASDSAIAFFEAHHDERWMLMLNYTAPHTPYAPPEEWQAAVDALPGPERFGEASLPRSYLGEIMWVDHNFERVLAALDRLHLTESTLVIITADHGEVMLPWHDCRGTGGERCGFNHSWTLYEDETHVPLTMSLPGRVEAHVVQKPVSHLDLAPTILDMCGLPPAPGMGGHSLRAALEGKDFTPSPIYADGRRASALRSGDWKLILHSPDDIIESWSRRTDEESMPKHELFDLATDPQEKTNLVHAQPEVVTRLLGELRDVRNLLFARFQNRQPEAVATRDAASVAATSAPEDRADNRVWYVAKPEDTPLSGTIRAVGGTITCGSVALPSICRADGDTLHLILAPGAILPFETRPWRAPLDVALGVAPDRLRLGTWGLALLEPGERLDSPEHLELATSTTMAPPIAQPHERAIYYWRSSSISLVDSPVAARPAVTGSFVAPEDGVSDPGADAQLGSEMRKVLKDLGYTH